MRASLKHSFNLKRLAAAVFGLALLSVSAGAQEPDAPQAPPQPQQPARAQNLMQRLNLSREQRQQLREIRTQSEPDVRAQTRRVRLARRALDEAIYADAVDENLVEQRARELSAAQSALIRLRAATELKIRRVLTAEQLQLFRALRREAQQRLQLQRRLNRTPPPRP
ncbi:MAG TPA: periplasmic heavy metal sensor [Pyrinomonadaceae bacterium]